MATATKGDRVFVERIFVAHGIKQFAGALSMDNDKGTAESKQTADALQEQREWLRVTLSCIGDAVITTDIKGCISFLNPVAQSLTG